MRRAAAVRPRRPGLLTRRPRIDRSSLVPLSPMVSPVDQYRMLISLVDRGLLSSAEFEEQVQRVARP